MNVAELVEKLQQLPTYLEVRISVDAEWYTVDDVRHRQDGQDHFAEVVG